MDLQEVFADHVQAAATELIEQVPNEYPDYHNDVNELAAALISVFMTNNFMEGVGRWLTVGRMIHHSTKCTCDDERKHAFLRRCDGILLTHTMEWRKVMFRDLLEEIGTPQNVIDDVLAAFNKHTLASASGMDVDVPDTFPENWCKDD